MVKRAFAVLALVLLPGASGWAQELGDDPGVAAALELLEVWVEAQRDYEDIPGLSIAVVHDQEVLWSAGFGFADVERRLCVHGRRPGEVCSVAIPTARAGWGRGAAC
jgi:CubicO group peptidase (beta-lactamase class C family)